MWCAGKPGPRHVAAALVVAALAVLAPLAGPASADREPEVWESLPHVVEVDFSSALVGLVGADNRFFVLDRAATAFRQVDAATFARQFPARDTPWRVVDDKGAGSIVALRASDGTEFRTKNAYCSEGEDTHHELFLGDRRVPDRVDPCNSVSALELVGDRLWLGTRRDGEYGGYPGEGVVIQSYPSGALVKRLDAAHGLTGDLIGVIRRDPQTGSVWIGTEWGFTVVDRALGIVLRRYYYEDFDAATGRAMVSLSPRPRPTNALALLERELEVTRPRAFYEAALTIPHADRESLSPQQRFSGVYAAANARSVATAFAPPSVNVLLPFVLETARSGGEAARHTAIGMLCAFNDRRVLDFLLDAEQRGVADLTDRWQIRECLNKYGALGLMPAATASDRLAQLLARERTALAALGAATPADAAAAIDTVIDSVRSLRALGSGDGMRLINEHFTASDGSARDGSLYDAVVARFMYDDAIAPAVVAGLHRLQTHVVYRGCTYLDPRYTPPGRAPRAAADYAEAIAVALEHVLHPTPAMMRSGPPTLALQSCAQAFRSQMANARVREEFRRDRYPRLTAEQRAVVDRLTAGAGGQAR